MRTTRSRIIRLAAGGLVALGAISPSLAAGATPESRDTQRSSLLRFSYTQQPPTVGAPICTPDGACVVPFSLSGTTADDLVGTMAQSGSATALPDGSLYANSTLVFSGTVRGCGKGIVAMRSTGLNQAGATSGQVEIVQGSGTGDLGGLRGSGVVLGGQVGADGVGTGEIALKVHCRGPRAAG